MALVSAPFHHDVAEGPKADAYWLTTSDDVRIRAAHWACESSRGTVLLFPGRTEYVEKYGRAADDFAALGYGTFGIDWRGQGLADRLIDNRAAGYVGAFPDYQKDIAAFLAAAEELALPKPWFLVAHSMGGCIGLRAAMEGLPVNGVVFTGPMWGIKIAPVMKPVAWVTTRLAKIFGFSDAIAPTTGELTYVLQQDFDGNTLTNDADMYAYMRKQVETYPDLSLGGPALHWLSEATVECQNLAAQPSPDLPCLTFLGTDEQIVTQVAIHDRMGRWDIGTLEMVQGGQHEVLMEGDELRGLVLTKIGAFFDANR
ncbi:alpha/beta fold hydrolase [Shimia haliotis]|uniref:Lysophospholipase n=1 Tax=Shimia haliotis TaxID=1280847 RepID=A0A1I4A2K9_9RHOB|nr:alpha/beta hydrolase [Shimia haliotis]SFK49999.1 lysophospholipase [Shimia haliotis]